MISIRRHNPTLMVVGNPPRRNYIAPSTMYACVVDGVVKAKGSAKAMRSLAKKLGGVVWDSPSAKVGDRLPRTNRNPAGQQLARKVLRFDYVHAEDGQEYTHDFSEDASRVTATVMDDGRKVILKAVDGRKIVEDF